MLIAIIGKGGVGKTTLTALLLRRLLDAGHTPVLAIDADPSSCLGPVLGIAADRSLGELRDMARDDAQRPAGMAKSDWLAVMAEEAIVEQQGFDLLTMGHPEGPGCYCFVNSLLRDHLARLSRTYRHVLVDCEAGHEHLSRRTAQRPDRLMCVVSRSRMAAQAVRRSLDLFESLHGQLPSQVDLVLNGVAPQRDDVLAEELVAVADGGKGRFTRIWRVPWDEAVTAREVSGSPMMSLHGFGAGFSAALVALQGWEEGL